MGILIGSVVLVLARLEFAWSLARLRPDPVTGARSRVRWLPGALIAATLLLCLAIKITYEELYPCLAIADRYCAFTTTHRHNLFGREF
ncbi:MAG: hypothetical protein M3Y37_09405 [Chloroflexota bacterium]|nr:hypothetical protein [Chloroflexota bacterium]